MVPLAKVLVITALSRTLHLGRTAAGGTELAEGLNQLSFGVVLLSTRPAVSAQLAARDSAINAGNADAEPLLNFI